MPSPFELLEIQPTLDLDEINKAFESSKERLNEDELSFVQKSLIATPKTGFNGQVKPGEFKSQEDSVKGSLEIMAFDLLNLSPSVLDNSPDDSAMPDIEVIKQRINETYLSIHAPTINGQRDALWHVYEFLMNKSKNYFLQKKQEMSRQVPFVASSEGGPSSSSQSEATDTAASESQGLTHLTKDRPKQVKRAPSRRQRDNAQTEAGSSAPVESSAAPAAEISSMSEDEPEINPSDIVFSAPASSSAVNPVSRLHAAALALIHHMTERDDVIWQKGIFRINGGSDNPEGKTRQIYFSDLIKSIQAGDLPDFAELPPHTCADLLKHIFRELNNVYHSPLVPDDANLKNQADMESTLGASEYQIMNSLLHLLGKIAGNAGINNMTANNLAIVMVSIYPSPPTKPVNLQTQINAHTETSLQLEEQAPEESLSESLRTPNFNRFFSPAPSSAPIEMAISPIEKVKTAVFNAFANYNRFHANLKQGTSMDYTSDTNPVTRGHAPGVLTRLRHTVRGANNSTQLCVEVAAPFMQPHVIVERIRTFINTRQSIHNHSFATYLMDELVKIENPGARLPAKYTQDQIRDMLNSLEDQFPAPSQNITPH